MYSFQLQTNLCEIDVVGNPMFSQYRISGTMATRIRRRSRRALPSLRRLRSANRPSSEPQVVDLTCTGDDEVYDLTGVSETPIVLAEHSPIVISDTPVGARPVSQAVESQLPDLPPFQLPESETEELPTFPFIVSNSRNGGSEQQEKSSTVSCPICFDSLSQIRARNIQLVSTKCGHVFCQQCIDDLLKDRSMLSSPCPTCRKTISKKTIHPIYI